MAQAARLSMRMQKELKLLLSDPPHGASFPHLSSAAAGSADIFTLSTIDAQIEGPEDTVYANGVFNVKIQIPERYPFQPPIVAFATPIYHPNIDDSGRICLDILNLPPKGAWQPSLNISTVLTSIRLLLTEPNPDDGLMCDVSREYKYNRQTFDYKAREMTEKYAIVKPDGSSVSHQIQNSLNAGDVKSHGDEKTYESGNHEKLKLTVESSLPHKEDRDTAAKDIPYSQLLFANFEDLQKDGNAKRKAVIGFGEADMYSNNELKPSRKKLSLALPRQSQKKDMCGEELTTGASASCKEYKKTHSNGKKFSLGSNQPFNTVTSSSFRTSAAKSDNNRLNQKLSFKPHGDSQLNEVSKTEVLAHTDMEPEMNQNHDAKFFNNYGLGKAPLLESIVVLDSDDSEKEEETVCSRSRLSLARRALKCKTLNN